MGDVLVEQALVLSFVEMRERLVAAPSARMRQDDVIILQQEAFGPLPAVLLHLGVQGASFIGHSGFRTAIDAAA